MATASSTIAPNVHEPLKGGCLCGDVSYTLNFPADSKFPPEAIECHCFQCRKQTGALITPFINLNPSQVSIQPESPGQGRHLAYESSPGVLRGFCSRCGSTLYWRTEQAPNEIGILTGTLDPEVLRGPDARALTVPSGGRFWYKEVITGVTDLDGPGFGPKYVEGSDGAKID
ncbi:MAG: hypothetical protein M1814_004672 [Vezdaea aestivalis]|nr:MAG: hypothetical protein M1814_004672 [Vezdaea aestivalis]